MNYLHTKLLIGAFLISLLGACTEAKLTEDALSGITPDQLGDLTVPELTISPVKKVIAVSGQADFVAQGGIPPYQYDIFDGDGTLDSSSGHYTAPNQVGNVMVRVKDRRASEAFAFVEVTENPVIGPATKTLAINNKFPFSVSGGRPPYAWTVSNGEGTVDSTGLYTAPSSAGTAKVRVTDTAGRYSEADLTINPALSIQPKDAVVAKSESTTFSATGGVSPYKFKLLSGGGSINDTTGEYFAPANMGLAAVQVEDSIGNVDVTIVTISNPLRIDPPKLVLVKNSQFDFHAQGGTPPYAYSASVGSIDSTTGRYTAPAVAGGPHTVTVTDATGATSSAQVTINDSLQFVINNVTIAVNQTYTFEITGGVGPTYFFSVPPTQGSFSGYTYTAPATPGIYTVTVQDSQVPTANIATATVFVNPELSIAPIETTIAVTNDAQFVAAGGVPPYVFSVVAGGPAGTSIDANAGLFTAGTVTGDATVRVSDSYKSSPSASITSSTDDAVVHINPALVIDPATATLVKGTNKTFTTTGGVGTITFSVASGGGSVNPSSGVYSAPNTTGTAIVHAEDTLGNWSEAIVTIVEPLQIVPADVAIHIGNSMTFSAVGGVAPYSYSVATGGGVVNASSGIFTAPPTPGIVTVRVIDAMNNTSDSIVSVYADLMIVPQTKVMVVGASTTFSAIGGLPSYSYSVLEGVSGGSVNSSTGQYTAPGIPGTYHVRVTDAQSNTSDAVVTVNAALSISPATKTLAINNKASFVAAGGVPPYIFTVAAGGGTVIPSTGDYTAPNASGSATVRVTDADGNTADAVVTITGGIAISPTTKTVAVNDPAFRFSATGGVSPYTYSVSQGVGSVVATGGSAGDYTSTVVGTAKVRVTDTLGNFAEADVNVTDALAIAPATKTLAVNSVFDRFAASGGLPPYTYAVVEGGGGTINSSTGVYTAPGSVGTYHVRVTDSLSHTSTATVTINAALAISPSPKTVVKNGAIHFTATGGVSPYTFSIQSGGGAIGATSGDYTAPASTGSAVVRVTDSFGSTADANVTINDTLAISPTTKLMVVNGTFTFTASGGVPPYTFSKLSGDGAITVGGDYTALATAGAAVVRVTDADGSTSDANITINPALSITPTSVSLAVNNSYDFTAAGGIPPYTFAVVEGASGGTVTTSTATGHYTAPAAVGAGTYHVRVTDAVSTTATATVTLTGPVAIVPSSKTLAVGDPDFTFTATGGVGPYTFSKVSGSGTMAANGVYQVPGASGSAVVRVTDSLNNTSDATITITDALQISPSTKTLAVNNQFDRFTATGGTGPYAYSVVEGGGGTVVADSGVYTAPATPGTYHVRVTDSLSHTSTATVTVNAGLTISPSTVTLLKNGTVTFTASNGVGPYTFAMNLGGGSVVAGTGVYTAPNATGSAIVRVTDSLSNYADATITINDVLAISPATKVMVVNGNFTFTATGGIPPYAYSKVSGVGTMAANGDYSAGAAAGTAVVRVTDSTSATSDANVTVNDLLAIAPTTITLAPGNQTTFTASGGVPTYSWAVVEGVSGGSVDGSGVYTAPATPGTYHVRVTDSASSTASATITVNAALAIDPSTKVLYVGDPDFTFSATGGVGPYTYSKVSGTGTMAANGVYQVPGAAGSAVVRVTDSLNNTSDASITIKTGLSISPTAVTLATGGTQTFTASGGTSPYTFSVVEGATGGTLSGGDFTAGTTPGTYHVRVTDDLGWTKDATVTVASPIAISPTTPTVEKGQTVTFSGSNGIPGYTFSVQSSTCVGGSNGTINATTGVYTAPYEICSAVVRVTDSANYYAETTVNITHTPGTYVLEFKDAAKFTQSDSTNGTTFPGTTVELKQINRTVTHTNDGDFTGTHQGTVVSGGSVTLP